VSVYYPIIFASVVVLIIGLIEIALIRFLHREWWGRCWIKWSALGLPVIGVGCIILWSIGTVKDIRWILAIGATGTALTFVLEIALMFSLPFSGVLGFLNRFLDWLHLRRSVGVQYAINEKRRAFLKMTAAALPAISVGMGAAGIARGFGPILTPVIEMKFPGLPPGLDGLKILQLSDMHLGIYQQLSDLEGVLLSAEALEPDVVLVTGDIADRLNILPEALKMIDQFRAPHGTFACLGNHEYYRGIYEVRKAFDEGPVPLLVSEHRVVPINGSSLVIAGANDPRYMNRDNDAYLRQTIVQATDRTPSDGFIVLMCHRPEGLDPAAEFDIPLVLSGHTHGGQFGLFGRSAFQPLMPGRYLWGRYQKNNSQMYTSAGVGHWFPFRLGCPPEAPVIVLRRI